MKLYTFIAVLFLLSFSCAKKDQYRVGQQWNYKTRPTEKSSTLTILKIEDYPETGKVIHISVSGLKMKNPASPTGYAENLSHLPLSEEALNKSVTSLKKEVYKKPDSLEMDGYSTGKKNSIKEMPGYLPFLFLRS